MGNLLTRLAFFFSFFNRQPETKPTVKVAVQRVEIPPPSTWKGIPEGMLIGKDEDGELCLLEPLDPSKMVK